MKQMCSYQQNKLFVPAILDSIFLNKILNLNFMDEKIMIEMKTH